MNSKLEPTNSLIWALVILLGFVFNASAAPYHVQVTNKFYNPNALNGDQFGSAAALDANTAVVGAPFADDRGSNSGAVVVYHVTLDSNNTQINSLEAILHGSDSLPEDAFGSAVAISGDVILVSAPGADTTGINSNSGAVYIFRKTNGNWVQEKKLVPTANEGFGAAVAVSGNFAFVGAPENDDVATDSGAVYVYNYRGSSTGWSYLQTLLAPNGTLSDAFGKAVAAFQDQVIVGAPAHSLKIVNYGSAHIFKFNNGMYQTDAILTRANGDALSDQFGAAVDINANYAVVGAPLSDLRGTDSGAAFISVKATTGWQYFATLQASDGQSYDHFGASVALRDNKAMAGSPFNLGVGAAYLFHLAAPEVELFKFTASDRSSFDNFGTAVDTSRGSDGEVYIFGSPGDDDRGIDAGSAYARIDGFLSIPNDCIQNSDCNDNNACTTDSCVNGECQNLNNSNLCNDGIFCNGADTCSGGTCSLHAGNPCPGADGDIDCSETCSESAKACSANDPDGSLCNDGNVSTRYDMCSLGICAGISSTRCLRAGRYCTKNSQCCSKSCNLSTKKCR